MAPARVKVSYKCRLVTSLESKISAWLTTQFMLFIITGDQFSNLANPRLKSPNHIVFNKLIFKMLFFEISKYNPMVQSVLSGVPIHVLKWEPNLGY